MTESAPRTIAVLTSGGDCAGLNAVIRAVVHRAIQTHGWRVLGIRNGPQGLMDRPPDWEELTLELFTGSILRLGGTILGTTSSGDPFAYPMADGSVCDRSEEFIEGYRGLGLGGLIGIGGDGSLRLLDRLTRQGDIPFVAVPKTIDNDVPGTEFSVGFSTAVETAVEALDRLQPTAASHHRVMVLEVMGRDAGHIALHAGIGGGADVVLIPEIPYRLESVAEKIRSLKAQGRNHALVVISEAARPVAGQAAMESDADGRAHYGGMGQIVGRRIAELTGAEVRVTVLGHIQRGGTPSANDRIIASAFGVKAVDLLARGVNGRMVAWSRRGLIEVPLADIVGRIQGVDLDGTLLTTARGLGICLGD